MKLYSNKPTRLMVVATAALLVGMVGVASATHVVPTTSADSNHEEFSYLGLGLGDHITVCFGAAEVDGWSSIDVDVHDPSSGDPVHSQNVPVPFGGAGPVNTPVDCLGGAVSTDTTTVPSDWSAWADDDAGSVLEPAGFARITVTEIDDGPDTCDGAGLAWAEPCTGSNNLLSSTGVATQFSFCGQASASGIAYPSGSPISAPTSTVVTRTIFLDGPLFFALDCSLDSGTTGDVADAYNLVVEEFNDSAVCTGADPAPPLVCLFPFPSTGFSCAAAGQAGIATAGTAGWADVNPGICSVAATGGSDFTSPASGPGTVVGLTNSPVVVTFNP